MSDQAARLRKLLAEPRRCAVLAVELQVGVVGEGAMFPALASEVAARGVIERAAALCAAARRAGALVVHCTAVDHPGVPRSTNTRIGVLAERMVAQRGVSPIAAGSPGASPCPQLGIASDDLVMDRARGLTPFADGTLEAVLRERGMATVVVCGVSANVGVLGAVLSAADLGYDVVVAADAIAGVPGEYLDAVVEHSMTMVATVGTVEAVCAALDG